MFGEFHIASAQAAVLHFKTEDWERFDSVPFFIDNFYRMKEEVEISWKNIEKSGHS